ncbi:MAG TPA: CoA transferase [Dehalococcoidia bacterium]
MTGLPLEGVRVLDLTRVWAGPLATRILADFGAEVIKVESRSARGPASVPAEYARRSGFYPNGEAGERPWNRNGFHNKMNRNKRSVTIELNTEDGVALFRRLVAVSDVVIENYSPRVMANFGLDYPRLREVRPDIIMVSMPGYGMTGPYRDRVSYGTTLEPEAGLSSLMGYPDRGPQRLGVAYPDPVAGIHAAGAVLMALWHRRRTGRGQYVDLAQVETAVNVIGEYVVGYQLNGRRPARLGNRHPWMAPHGCYPCRGEDRWITIAVGDDAAWQGLCRVLGRPDLAADPRLATPQGRWEHQEEIDTAIRSWTQDQEMLDAMHRLQAAGVPAGAVLDARDLATNEHLEARGFFPRLTHPDAGTHPYPGQPIRLSATPAVFRTDAPRLGEHNEEVFKGLAGLSDQEYDRLVEQGVIGDRPPH